MTLVNFQEKFDNTYEEVFQKTLVAKEIMNTRFEPVLRYGESIERFAYDLSAVRVRTVTRNQASTVDSLVDSTELLTINLEKEIVFQISDGEITQSGPLDPAEVIGAEAAKKIKIDLDARCFAEVLNALYTFDNGDLTTGTSSGTPITLNSTTVPQMVARMGAKLVYRNNQDISSGLAFVVDSYAASDITQYLMGKNIDLAGATFQNGYSGDVQNARMYITENLTGTAVLYIPQTPTDGDTVTIGGVTFTFKTTLGTTPGNVLISGSADAARANLVSLVNTPGTTTTYGVALSSANQVVLQDALKLTATDVAATDLTTFVGIGSGRLVVGGTLTNTNNTWSKNYINAYFGKRGAIDLVIQDSKSVDMRKLSDRRGWNIFSSYLAGIKTFADGAKKFLNVWISA